MPTDDHSVVNGRRLPVRYNPLSSLDLHDDMGLKQRRYFGGDGKVVEDIGYRHSNGDRSHVFPHRYDWTRAEQGSPSKIPGNKIHGIEGLDR